MTMLTFRQVSTSPLDPYERGTTSKYKTFSKLEADYKLLKERLHGVFEVRGIRETENEEGYMVDIWCKIPSEPFPNRLDYDVIIRFFMESKLVGKVNQNTKVQVFSNSPSFTFTYAYVFNKKGSIIPDYKNKLSPRSLVEMPKVTNPKMLVGFEKSLFFTFLLLKDEGVFKDISNFVKKNSIKIMKFSKFDPVTSDDKLRQYNLVKNHEKQLYNEYKKRNSFGFF